MQLNDIMELIGMACMVAITVAFAIISWRMETKWEKEKDDN